MRGKGWEGRVGVGRKEGVGKKGLGDKRCMLVGVVVLVFIMCGAVIAIFKHRLTGEGEGVGRKGWGGTEGRGGEERVGRQAMHACGSCGSSIHHVWSRPSSLSSCTDSQVRGRGGKEGVGEEGVGRKGLGWEGRVGGRGGKEGLQDKWCMLVGVVFPVFIMCGAVIAIFVHRFTGKGEGWGGRVGRGGRGWETRGACLWELWSWCSSCVEPSSLSSCTDSRVRGGVGRKGGGGGRREGEERVGRQAMHACGSCGPGVHHVLSRHRYLHAQIHG